MRKYDDEFKRESIQSKAAASLNRSTLHNARHRESRQDLKSVMHDLDD